MAREAEQGLDPDRHGGPRFGLIIDRVVASGRRLEHRRRQSLDGLELDYNRIFNDQIHPVPDLHRVALIDERQLLLSLETKRFGSQLMTKAGLVARFEQPGPQIAMHANRLPDNHFG